MMKQLEQIEAKLKVLDHLRRVHRVKPEIIEAAKQKIGADLADAVSGDLSVALADQLGEEVARLERGDLRAGDTVKFSYGADDYVAKLLRVDSDTVVVDEIRKNGIQLNRNQVSVEPKALAGL